MELLAKLLHIPGIGFLISILLSIQPESGIFALCENLLISTRIDMAWVYGYRFLSGDMTEIAT